MAVHKKESGLKAQAAGAPCVADDNSAKYENRQDMAYALNQAVIVLRGIAALLHAGSDYGNPDKVEEEVVMPAAEMTAGLGEEIQAILDSLYVFGHYADEEARRHG